MIPNVAGRIISLALCEYNLSIVDENNGCREIATRQSASESFLRGRSKGRGIDHLRVGQNNADTRHVGDDGGTPSVRNGGQRASND